MSRVYHIPFTGVLRRVHEGPDLTEVIVSNLPADYWISPESTSYVWTSYIHNLNVKKLPTSNQADLLTFLAEFDDSVAMLSTKLVSSLSYGGVKWGWMPMVSDIMACNTAGNNVKNSILEGSRRTAKYKTSYNIRKNTGDINVSGGSLYHEWDVTVKFSGSISYENDILSFYDYMGFHPTPKLFWDLIPLSFAIDYILPIGDTIQRITPSKGWVKAANFTGWRVITARVREKWKQPPRDYNKCSFNANAAISTYVYRDYLDGVTLEEKKVPRDPKGLNSPDLSQLFDLAYLSNAFYGAGHRALKSLSR
jgi:hypothetical protein